MLLERERIVEENLFRCDYTKIHGRVAYGGFTLAEDRMLAKYLRTMVFNRLYDIPESSHFDAYLRHTAFSQEGEKRVLECLDTRYNERRNWRVAEAFAETILVDQYKVIIPWSTRREQRRNNDAVFGPDIVGLLPDELGARLVIGEIKSSDEERHPPQVMQYAKRNMCRQLHEIVADDSVIFRQLEWLFHRIRPSQEQYYQSAIQRYFSSAPNSYWVVGILIRGVGADDRDLAACARKLDEAISIHTECTLNAFYLPWKVKELDLWVHKGERDV